MEEEKKEQLLDKTKKQVEEKINTILESGIDMNNLEALGELVDIHKDICNEEYWKNEKEAMKMRYRDYDEYNESKYGRRGRDSRGRYTARGRGRYQGEDMIEEMREHYGNYMESGRYNGSEKEKAFDYMLQSAEEFFYYLMEEVESPEQLEKIQKTARKISEMRM